LTYQLPFSKSRFSYNHHYPYNGFPLKSITDDLRSIESIGNLPQMKVMKVNYTHNNMMIQEFQHSVELQLIQVMTTKMQMILFGSIGNLIQMKLMKIIYNTKNMTTQDFQ
jgi:hypothetical protein